MHGIPVNNASVYHKSMQTFFFSHSIECVALCTLKPGFEHKKVLRRNVGEKFSDNHQQSQVFLRYELSTRMCSIFMLVGNSLTVSVKEVKKKCSVAYECIHKNIKCIAVEM